MSGRVLVVAPRFFGYEDAIADEFRRQGFEVTYVDERPSNSSAVRAILRVAPRLAARRLQKYFAAQTALVAGETYDLVLVIKGETVSVALLNAVRASSPSAVFALYTYDSFSNSPRAAQIRDHFDLAYSFDAADTRLDPRFAYKPLFYSEHFLRMRDQEKKFDLGFVGTMHSDRHAVIKQAMGLVERPYAFLHVQARWYYWLKRLTDRRWRSVSRSEVSFNKLELADVASVFASSVGVLDVQREGQSGLTMRTFEVLAAGAALVTTNAAIRDAPLYRPETVYVLGDDNAESLPAWLAASAPLPRAALSPYSIDTWVADLARDALGGAG